MSSSMPVPEDADSLAMACGAAITATVITLRVSKCKVRFNDQRQTTRHLLKRVGSTPPYGQPYAAHSEQLVPQCMPLPRAACAAGVSPAPGHRCR